MTPKPGQNYLSPLCLRTGKSSNPNGFMRFRKMTNSNVFRQDFRVYVDVFKRTIRSITFVVEKD
jgi:hypothetical protein